MICPRCGTQAISDHDRCSRCAGVLVEPESADFEPVAVVAAPTRRGELLQATAGTVTVSLVELARAKKLAAAPVPGPDSGHPPAVGPPVGPPKIPWPSPPAAQPTPASGAPAAYPGAAPSGPGAGAGPFPGPAAGQGGGPLPSAPAPGPTWATPEAAGQPWPPPPVPSGPWPPPAQPEGTALRGERGNPQPTTIAEPPVWSPIEGAPDRSARLAQSPPPAPAAPTPLRVRTESPTRTESDTPWVGSSAGWAAPGGERWLTGSLPATYWWQSLVMLLLVPPVGAAALYFSWQVTRKSGLGDGPGAMRASRLARTCCLLGAFIFAVALIVYTGTNPN